MKALIVIDVQNDFLSGSLGSEDARAIVPKVRELIEQFHSEGNAIYYTQDTHTYDYTSTQEGKKLPVMHCIFGSWGWRIADGIDIPFGSATHPVYHLNKSMFAYDDWEEEHLEQYEEVVICGLVSSICVISNALAIKMLYPELPIKFAANASAGLTPENHAAAIEVMKSCQIEIV